MGKTNQTLHSRRAVARRQLWGLTAGVKTNQGLRIVSLVMQQNGGKYHRYNQVPDPGYNEGK